MAETKRQRNFATVVYPESAPQGWIQILKDKHIPTFISPLHDKDVNPDGELKKPHYHVLLMFEGMKGFDSQVKPIFDEIGGVGREAVNSLRGYARYLCHLDNPEKYQYSTADVVQMGGADYSAAIHLASDDQAILRDIMAFVRINQIYSLAELMDITAVCNQDWYNVLTTSRTYVIGEYIKALTWEADRKYVRHAERNKELIDPRTGEVMRCDENTDNT